MTQLRLIDAQYPVQKQCKDCRQWFEKETFPHESARCMECYLARSRERRQLRKERDNARSRELYAQSPERRAKQAESSWKSRLKHEYGITSDIHQMMYENQDGKCYFCGLAKPARRHDGLVIDHDKDTGFVRGLLCRQCNANFIDEYKKLPREFQDSPRTNAYLFRGETGDYIEEIKQRMVSGE